ncbi:MAG: hypothetical protein AB8G26_02255 [Ilumatobacter sp.]
MTVLIAAAAVLVIVSLALAWTATLTLYLKVPLLTRAFPAGFQLVRAHIDYLLMAMLMTTFVVLADRVDVGFSVALQWTIVVGAVWNPLGFVVLATRAGQRGPRPGFETWATVVGFVPATVGFGGAAISILGSV